VNLKGREFAEDDDYGDAFDADVEGPAAESALPEPAHNYEMLTNPRRTRSDRPKPPKSSSSRPKSSKSRGKPLEIPESQFDIDLDDDMGEIMSQINGSQGGGWDDFQSGGGGGYGTDMSQPSGYYDDLYGDDEEGMMRKA
jgi:hypothetical protein